MIYKYKELEKLKEVEVGDILINDKRRTMELVVELRRGGESSYVLVDISEGVLYWDTEVDDLEDILMYVDLETRRVTDYTLNLCQKRLSLLDTGSCVLDLEGNGEGLNNIGMAVDGGRGYIYLLKMKGTKEASIDVIEGVYEDIDGFLEAFKGKTIVTKTEIEVLSFN